MSASVATRAIEWGRRSMRGCGATGSDRTVSQANELAADLVPVAFGLGADLERAREALFTELRKDELGRAGIDASDGRTVEPERVDDAITGRVGPGGRRVERHARPERDLDPKIAAIDRFLDREVEDSLPRLELVEGCRAVPQGRELPVQRGSHQAPVRNGLDLG